MNEYGDTQAMLYFFGAVITAVGIGAIALGAYILSTAVHFSQ